MTTTSFVGGFSGGFQNGFGEGSSGVASLDPPLLQQTKSEIRSLASEIARLAHSTIEPSDFYSGFLPRLITAWALKLVPCGKPVPACVSMAN